MTGVHDTLPRPPHPGEAGLHAVLDAIAGEIGADRVVSPLRDGREDLPSVDIGPNVGMYGSRKVLGIVRPQSVGDVQAIVRILGRSAEPVPLHPFGTGRNWGLGSREPVRDHAILLDLGGLDRVRELDVDAGWAVVEPGVTQGRLAAMLAETDRMLNVTASSAHTSIIGNALDRGVGLRHQRVDDMAGLEVVLPDGEMVHAGWWPVAGRATAVYPHGLGPSLMPLFLQSNLGIVTSAAIRLLPRPEARKVLRFGFGADVMAAAIDELRRWVSQGLVRGVVKVYDATSTGLYGGSASAFTAHVNVEGTPASVGAMTDVIHAEAARSGLFSARPPESGPVGSEGGPDVVTAMVERASGGDPGLNDDLLRATLGRPAETVDESGKGWLFFLPLVPFTGEAIRHAHGLLDRVFSETGVRCGSTINSLGPDVIDLVVSIKFERTDEEAERAHAALDRLYHLFAEAGFLPYRLDVDHAGWIDRLSPDPAARRLARRLKAVLDPDGVIAPGRYA